MVKKNSNKQTNNMDKWKTDKWRLIHIYISKCFSNVYLNSWDRKLIDLKVLFPPLMKKQIKESNQRVRYSMQRNFTDSSVKV